MVYKSSPIKVQIIDAHTLVLVMIRFIQWCYIGVVATKTLRIILDDATFLYSLVICDGARDYEIRE